MKYKATPHAKAIHSIIVNLKRPYKYQVVAKKLNEAAIKTHDELSSKSRTS